MLIKFQKTKTDRMIMYDILSTSSKHYNNKQVFSLLSLTLAEDRLPAPSLGGIFWQIYGIYFLKMGRGLSHLDDMTNLTQLTSQ